MEKTEIFRIENSQGYGPYTGTDPSNWLDRGNQNLRPEPEKDQIPNLPAYWSHQEFFSGFESLEQLLLWFNVREIRSLYQQGFRVTKFSVSQLLKGNHQVLFKKEACVIVHNLSIDELWELRREIFA